MRNTKYKAVWEKHHGKPKYGWHIHHIDGNPRNNSIDNLICVSPKMHYLIHKEQHELYGLAKDAAAARYLWRADYGEIPEPWNKGKKGQIAWNKGLKGIQIAWNKGIPVSEDTKSKLRSQPYCKECIDVDTGTRYNSKIAMAKAVGLNRTTNEFKRRCKF